jgi:5'-3' exonuclease
LYGFVSPKFIHVVHILAFLFSFVGVAGIGPKIAASLINEFGSLDNLLDNLDKVPQQKRRETLQNSIEIAKLSRKLVELNCAVPQEAFSGFPQDVFAVRELRMEPIDIPRLVSFYDEMGFKELKRTLLLKSKGLKTTRSKSSGAWTKNQSRSKTTIPKPEDYADVPF